MTISWRLNNATAGPVIVEIKLKDGTNLRKTGEYPPGSPQNPLSDEALFEKYRSCARLVLPEKETEESIKVIMNLESIDNIRELLNLLIGRNAGKSPYH